MPNLDKTGPRGQGPRTGRGVGDCTDENGNAAPRPGFGRGAGRGAGRPRRGRGGNRPNS